MTGAIARKIFPGRKIRGLCSVAGVFATLATFLCIGTYADYHGAEPAADLAAESAVDASLQGRVVAVTGLVQKRWGDLPPSDFMSFDGESTRAFLAEKCKRSGKSSTCRFWQADDIGIGNFTLEPPFRQLYLDAAPIVSHDNSIELRYWPINKRYTVFASLDADGRTLRPISFPGPWPRTAMIIADEQANARRYIADRAASFRGWAWVACFVSSLVFLTASYFPTSADPGNRSALKRALLWALLILGPNIGAMALSYSPWFFHVDLLFPVAIAGFIVWGVRQMMRYFDTGLLAAT